MVWILFISKEKKLKITNKTTLYAGITAVGRTITMLVDVTRVGERKHPISYGNAHKPLAKHSLLLDRPFICITSSQFIDLSSSLYSIFGERTWFGLPPENVNYLSANKYKPKYNISKYTCIIVQSTVVIT